MRSDEKSEQETEVTRSLCIWCKVRPVATGGADYCSVDCRRREIAHWIDSEGRKQERAVLVAFLTWMEKIGLAITKKADVTSEQIVDAYHLARAREEKW